MGGGLLAPKLPGEPAPRIHPVAHPPHKMPNPRPRAQTRRRRGPAEEEAVAGCPL
jgi:hypothetical protein